mmetsp:Transcript_11074/g.41013  ORF Transcript_11074/g.41013 Transcript_11074/m.41013 type:complete len:337 (+) Transcript_11074:3046-4056(+)
MARFLSKREAMKTSPPRQAVDPSSEFSFSATSSSAFLSASRTSSVSWVSPSTFPVLVDWLESAGFKEEPSVARPVRATPEEETDVDDVATTARAVASVTIRSVPVTSVPTRKPSATSRRDQCGGNANLRFAGEVAFESLVASIAAIAAASASTRASLARSNSASGSELGRNLGKYAEGVHTSTPRGRDSFWNESVVGSSVTTTTGNAPRTTCDAYHPAALSTQCVCVATSSAFFGRDAKHICGVRPRIALDFFAKRRCTETAVLVARQKSLGKCLTPLDVSGSVVNLRSDRTTRGSPTTSAFPSSEVSKTTSAALGTAAARNASANSTSARASGMA